MSELSSGDCAPNSLGRRLGEPARGFARADRGQLQAGMVEQILVAGDDRLGFRGSREREQIVVAAVAQHRLWIDRVVEHHRYALDRAHGLLGLALVQQRAEVWLREVIPDLNDQRRTGDDLERVTVDRLQQQRGRRLRIADER